MTSFEMVTRSSLQISAACSPTYSRTANTRGGSVGQLLLEYFEDIPEMPGCGALLGIAP